MWRVIHPISSSRCILSRKVRRRGSVKEPQGSSPSQGDAAEIADFVKKHEGARFLGLNVSSAKVAANYLKTQNFDVEGPVPGSIMKEGETKTPAPMWYSVSTADKPLLTSWDSACRFSLSNTFPAMIGRKGTQRGLDETSQHSDWHSCCMVRCTRSEGPATHASRCGLCSR